MRVFLGIDPGSKGAYVVMNEREKILAHYLNPSGKSLYEVLVEWRPERVYIEKAQAMSKGGKQGANSIFTYGKGFGELLAAIDIAEVSSVQIPPRTWQGPMLTGTNTHDSPKFRAAAAYRRLFPEYCELIANRMGRLHDGVVDATLICLYGIQNI